MDNTAERLAALIEEAPVRTVARLSVTNEALRHRATLELAEYLAHGLERPWTVQDKAQLALPL